MVEVRQLRIESALETVHREIDAALTEKRAFTDFLARLEALEPREGPNQTPVAASATGDGGLSTLTGIGDVATDDLRAVRTAYRETVMSVPHYESDYDDTLAENVRAEFGGELARYVTGGGGLTPVVYGALREESERARTERVRFLAVLRRERESLQQAEATLNECERRAVELADRLDEGTSTGALEAAGEELRELERRCGAVSEARQETIHTRSVTRLSGVDGDSLTGYLYSSCDSTCPVLADVAQCLGTVRYLRRRTLR
ncbi:MAG: hypothetical protein ABEJ22_04245 [Haloferacaceae archaeon]